ncbi:MAG: aromatic-ring-hydroxylating dioxygenase subunit beta, partial [Luminiphilus sp.]
MRAAHTPLTRASEVPYETLCQFLYQEARLLDQRKFGQWNDLFAEGGMYWIPLEEDQEDPLNHLSLAYEDSMMRQVRINRLNHDRAWSQKPRSRTSHTVSAIVVEAVCEVSNQLIVGSAF